MKIDKGYDQCESMRWLPWYKIYEYIASYLDRHRRTLDFPSILETALMAVQNNNAENAKR